MRVRLPLYTLLLPYPLCLISSRKGSWSQPSSILGGSTKAYHAGLKGDGPCVQNQPILLETSLGDAAGCVLIERNAGRPAFLFAFVWLVVDPPPFKR